MSWTSNAESDASDIKPISDIFSPSKAPSSVYPRDTTFYYDYKTFLVEGTLFKFPLTVLAMESTIFRDMMELPVSLQPEGSTDENPIRLESVLKDDFRQLLRILAPPYREPVPVLTFSEWTSVLKLADMWCMDVVKEHAILTMSGLSGIDPVDKVVVGRKYGIKDWLLPAFNVILQRSQSFTEHDLERLGAPTLLQLVEGTLFRFPINLLAKESEVFRDMMEIPAPAQAEGLTDENPIRLDGVLHDDFVKLLTILAPPFKEPVPTLSFSEWTSVLKLADMWCMDVVKEHAIATMNRISKVDPLDKVVVARKYGVDSWLVPSFNALLRRSKPWDEQDVERLGLSTVLKLVELRDRLRPQSQYGFSWEIALARQEIPGLVDFREAITVELPDFKGTSSKDLI
ncbi:hypothetical protein DFH05DRAFT_1453874 [Lentinula detonsa]|uniref:BTB domain-containing protein n=1 Tax=Lentinula detonsa TaxID=2804962 RepID=A0A9W8NQZ6_9AGAR|nr:hypothetical protein DFH05DRAFT_1453874 [Lentinula detonsa]